MRKLEIANAFEQNIATIRAAAAAGKREAGNTGSPVVIAGMSEIDQKKVGTAHAYPRIVYAIRSEAPPHFFDHL